MPTEESQEAPTWVHVWVVCQPFQLAIPLGIHDSACDAYQRVLPVELEKPPEQESVASGGPRTLSAHKLHGAERIFDDGSIQAPREEANLPVAGPSLADMVGTRQWAAARFACCRRAPALLRVCSLPPPRQG
mmetsp:Transcript_51130/g.121495  ORF Transcript_51130/g.121495 Transcript_51130/m.121495 type:complete len:132 (-) Transcript_51130:200-595(-)